MFEVVKYGNKCWWCQLNVASTAEHKYKKSDFRKLFSDENEEPTVFNKQIKKGVQGPNSTLLKFKKNLCSNCNNNRSSNIDKAYSKFFEYMIDNFESIIISGVIDFSNVFGTDWSKMKKELMRYILKHICCRLYENSISIPPVYIEFLNGSKSMTEVSFRFCYNINNLNAFKNGHPYLGVAPLDTNVNEDMTINYILSSYNFGPFKIVYLCSQGFHKGQHNEYEEYQNSSIVEVYRGDLNPVEDMMKYEYFHDELKRIKTHNKK